MELTPVYPIGSVLWSIIDFRVSPFNVAFIGYDGKQYYYGDTQYTLLPESQCFESREKLFEYLKNDA